MSLIILPRRKIIEPAPIAFVHKLRGMYRLRVRKADGRIRHDTGWFPNLITNQGLDYLYTNNQYLANCLVGTGNSAPANTDTTLNSQIAWVANNNGSAPPNGYSGSPPYYTYLNMSYEFGQGAAAGNLQEIGIGPDTSHCFSRALILNGVGSPTTLTILASEYLLVSYQLQLHSPTVDVTGSVTVSGTVCNYTLRASNVNTSWSMGGSNSYPDNMGIRNMQIYSDTTLQPVTGGPVGTFQGQANNGYVNGSYTTGQYYIDGTANFALTDCNLGSNNCALVTWGPRAGGFGQCQCIFGATIPKTSSQIMSLTFRQTWGRYP